MLDQNKNFLMIVSFFTLVLISLFYGYRDLSIGYDSYVYAMNFVYASDNYYSFEPFFDFITNLIRLFTDNYSIYFSLISFIIFFNFFYLKKLIYEGDNFLENQLIIFVSFIISSTWILTIITNAIRQGIALSFLYLFLWLFINKRFFYSLIFLMLSLLSHDSMVLFFLVFGFLFIRKENFFFALIIIFSLFYPLGFNEILIKFVSNSLGIDLYDQIKNYEIKADAWVGFQPNFYIYTIFWFSLFLFVYKYIFNNKNYLNLLKVFSVLMLVYFIFGFGGYSNRYAFFVWAFLPVIQSYTVHMFFSKYKIGGDIKNFLITFLFFISVINMLLNLGYLNVF